MTGGYIYCYLGNATAPDLDSFERLFSSIELSLENPETKQVFALSPTGEQVVVTREDIASQLAMKADVNVQWWFGRFEDIYCGFHTDTVNGRWRVTFRLDGIDHEPASAVVERLLAYFKSHCAGDDAVALVVDKSGALEETDWDAVVCGGQPLREIPDVLILPRSIVTPGFEDERRQLPECPMYDILGTEEREPVVEVRL